MCRLACVFYFPFFFASLPRCAFACVSSPQSGFLISAVVHELMFGIATSRFDGYQFLFFTLQGPAILASRPLSRWARRYGLFGITALRGSTIVWMYFTSMLFFHGVNRIFSFTYASTPWLP